MRLCMKTQDVSLEQRKLNSGILGASVANLSIEGLKESVVIRLRNTEPVPVSLILTGDAQYFSPASLTTKLEKSSGGY